MLNTLAHREPKRVLLASCANWHAAARLPAMLSRSGIQCDLLDHGDTMASASSLFRSRMATEDDPDAIAGRVVATASDYDRVIPCDDMLVRALLRQHGDAADRALPGSRESLNLLMVKTTFPDACRAAGLRVADSGVAASPEEARPLAKKLGGRVVVKGRWGAAGAAIRLADSPDAAARCAEELGCPVLVEAFVEGALVNLPALYERGQLVAAVASRKLHLVSPMGPSAVNEFFVMDPAIEAIARRMGEAFGLHGFVSADLIIAEDGQEPVLLEINCRPVPQLPLCRVVGVDMGAALAEVLAGRWSGAPRLPRRTRTVRLFPQDLIRRRAARGRILGALSWALSPAAWHDVPWSDPGLRQRFARDIRSN